MLQGPKLGYTGTTQGSGFKVWAQRMCKAIYGLIWVIKDIWRFMWIYIYTYTCMSKNTLVLDLDKDEGQGTQMGSNYFALRWSPKH